MATERFITVDGLAVSVSEEVYVAYMRSVWNEDKRRRYRVTVEVSIDGIHDGGYEFPSENPHVEDIVEQKLMLSLLSEALHHLADNERALINALYFSNKTEKDFAEETGVSQQAVSARKNRLLKKLRKIFD